jgi:hypothetical protein
MTASPYHWRWVGLGAKFLPAVAPAARNTRLT